MSDQKSSRVRISIAEIDSASDIWNIPQFTRILLYYIIQKNLKVKCSFYVVMLAALGWLYLIRITDTVSGIERRFEYIKENIVQY